MAGNQKMSPLEKKIADQIEYYFGDHNLPRDRFLKEQLQVDDGWVALETMLKFNRLKTLTSDQAVIVDSLKKSQTGLIEISEDSTKIRRSLDKPLPELNDEYNTAVKHKSVYIKGFPLETTLDEIKDWLSDKGTVENIHMRKGPQKTFKGSIFMVMNSEETAKEFVECSDAKKFKEHDLIVLMRDDYHTKKTEERKSSRAEAKAKAKSEKEENQKQAEQQEMKSLDEHKGCLLRFSGDLGQISREDFHEVFAGHADIKWIDFTRGAKEGTILFRSNAKEALDKAKQANGGKLQVKEKDVEWEVLEGDVEMETLKKIIESQQESLNKRKGKGRNVLLQMSHTSLQVVKWLLVFYLVRAGGQRGGRGRGRGGRKDRGGRDHPQYQGKKTKFDSDGEEDPSPKKRPLEENGKCSEEPAAKQAKSENGS
uniref:LA protein n=1 Tax=Denticeps clupeoides TaxID=299321 RepID=A0AAY4E198_9TELE